MELPFLTTRRTLPNTGLEETLYVSPSLRYVSVSRLGLFITAHASPAVALRNEKSNFLAPHWIPQNLLVPRTIPGIPWSYTENLEAIAFPVLKLEVNKQTDIQTERILYIEGMLQVDQVVHKFGSLGCTALFLANI